jgi:hypothetical protein
VNNQPDDRSLLAVAAMWTSLVTSIALEMALPALAGHWVDKKLDTGPLFVSLGAVFGLAVGLWHLLRITGRPMAPRGGSDEKHDRPDTPPPGGGDENR